MYGLCIVVLFILGFPHEGAAIGPLLRLLQALG